MNQPAKPESSKHVWLWALLALFMLGSVGVGIALVAFVLVKKPGEKPGASLMAFRGEGITPIDLTAFYDKSGSWDSGSEWQEAPRGPTVLGGVPFEANGLLRLSGRSAKNDNKPYRDEVKGIPVGKKFARLHVLHIVSYSTSQESPYARITLRYGDGTATSFPIIYGQHARDWHRPKYEYVSALGDPNSKVVWRGEYDATATSGRTLRIFKTTFTNPKPELEVATIDLSSEEITPNATIIAMSIGPANLPKPRDDPPSLPEPPEIYEGEMKFTAVDAESGQPVPNVKVRVSGTETGGSFRAPDAATDAKGQCVVKHPGDSTTSLAVSTFGDGVPEKTIRWQVSRTGEPIPTDYTFRVTKAVTVGGLVQDEAGQPVSGATLSMSQFTTAAEANALERVALGLTTLKTDEKGRWEFRSLPAGFGNFSVSVSHPGYADARFLSDGVDRNYVGEKISLRSLLSTNAVLKVRRGLSVSGRVLTEKGEPISGAKLLLGDSRFSNKPNQTRTDERGEFRLAGASAGTTYLTVQANGYSPAMQQVSVEAKTQPVEFRLAPGRVFKARIVDEFDTPVRTARITVDMWQNRQTVDLSGSTDTRGRVTINSMPEGGMSGSIYKAGYMSMGGIQFVANGEEQTFVLRKSATITGTVIDAETKEPVERFDVTRGQDGGDRIYWQDYNVIKGTVGGFSFRLDQQGITAIKVESDEHLPTIVSLGTNGVTHFDIELKKGTGPKGIVHAPDGQPAAGAQLMVLTPGGNLTMGAGKFENYSRDGRRVAETDALGSFSLRAYADGEKIITVHTNGYAETPFTNFVSGSTIKLQAWGTIEGVLNIGPHPGTNQSLMLTPGTMTGPSSFWYSFQDYRVITDDKGKFVISNAPPGERRIVRLIQTDQNSWAHSQPTDVMVKAGEVTRLTMGGDGHLIIGQLTTSDPSLTINWRNSGHHSLSSHPKPPPFRTKEEYRAWERSPEAVEARKKARSYTVQMSDTGTFRIEDVVPGNYDLNIHLREPNDGRGAMGKFLGSFTTNIVVPEFVKGPNVPPIDLGTLEVKVSAGNQSGRGAPPARAAANRP